MLHILPDRIALIREILEDSLTDVTIVAVAFNSFKLKAILADGSILHVSEHYARDTLGRYAYYWPDHSNNLIIGWDDSPHHAELPTFPHHKHVAAQENREPSSETSLADVLKFIRQKLTA